MKLVRAKMKIHRCDEIIVISNNGDQNLLDLKYTVRPRVKIAGL